MKLAYSYIKPKLNKIYQKRFENQCTVNSEWWQISEILVTEETFTKSSKF